MLSKKTKIILKLFVPQQKKPNTKHTIPERDKNLKNKTFVITGGTDGIGRVAVEMLYHMGANIVLLARNKIKAEVLIKELKSGSKYIYEDEIQPHHSEAEITEKRNKLKQITEKVLRKWLN